MSAQDPVDDTAEEDFELNFGYDLSMLKAMTEGIASNEDMAVGARLSKDTIACRKEAWTRFCHYFKSRESRGTVQLIPGSPKTAEDILRHDHPDLDFKSMAGFVTWLVAESRRGKLATTSLISISSGVLHFIATAKNSAVDNKVTSDLRRHICGKMLADGMSYKPETSRRFINADGHAALVQAALSDLYHPQDNTSRIQIVMWMAMTLEGGNRSGEMMGTRKDNTRGVRLEQAKITVTLDDLYLTFEGDGSKTEDGEYRPKLYRMQDYPYRSVVFLFLVLCERKKVLPCSAQEILDKSILNGEDKVEITFNAKDGYLFSKARKPDVCWDVCELDRILALLSFGAGFSNNVSTHAFRRTAAIMARAYGCSYEEIQLKLCHRLNTSVTRLYTGAVLSKDISASVWKMDDRTIDNLSLHPDMLQADSNAPCALNEAQRAQIYENEAFISASDDLEHLRAQAYEQYESRENFPQQVRDDLQKSWREYNRTYTRLYNEILGALWKEYFEDKHFAEDVLPSNALDQLPHDGEEVDWDARACEEFFTNNPMNSLSEVLDTIETATIRAIQGVDEADSWPIDPTLVEAAQSSSGAANVEPSSKPAALPRATSLELARRLLFDKSPDKLLACLDACIKIPKTLSLARSTRPGHEIVDGKCPGCGHRLDELTKTKAKTVARKQAGIDARHVIACLSQRAKDFEWRSLKDTLVRKIFTNPFDHAILPDEARKSTGRKKESDYVQPGASTPLDSYSLTRCLVNRLSARDDITCVEHSFTCSSKSIFRMHMLIEHNIFVPPHITNKKAFLAFQSGEWSTSSLQFPDPVYYDECGDYIANPAKLELFCQDLYNRRFVAACAKVVSYGDNPLIHVGETTTGQSKKADKKADTSCWKYVKEQTDGNVLSSETFCLLCAHDTSTTFTERMKPWNDSSAYVRHIRSCFLAFLDSVEAMGFGALVVEKSETEDVDGEGEDDYDEGKVSKSKPRISRKGPKNKHAYDQATVSKHTSQEGDGDDELDEEIDGGDDAADVVEGTSKKRKFSGIVKIVKNAAFLINDNKLACPDVVCQRNSTTFSDARSFANHLVLAHNIHFYPEQKKRQILKLEDLGFKDDAAFKDFLNGDPMNRHDRKN